MDFFKSPAFLLCTGLLIGIVLAEAAYYISAPLVLADGSVVPLIDRDYYPKVASLLSGAKDSIHIVMFSANYQTASQYADSHVNRLVQELVAAKNRGVDVRVIMDAQPEGNSRTANYLSKNNIPVTLINMTGSTHAKLIVIDGRITVVGSTNWSYYALDLNHEANVVISGESVSRSFESYFYSLIPSQAS